MARVTLLKVPTAVLTKSRIKNKLPKNILVVIVAVAVAVVVAVRPLLMEPGTRQRYS